MHTMRKKKETKRILLIILTIIILLVTACFTFAALNLTKTNQPIYDSPDNLNTQTDTTEKKNDSPDNTTMEHKTPEQYNGQTEDVDNANSIEFNNEQFRIPDDEL